MADENAKNEENSTAIATLDPSSLLKGEGDGGVKNDGGRSISYIGFYGEKAKADTRAPLDAVGIKVGEFYLHHIEPIKITPFSIHLIKYVRLYTIQDNKMNVTAALSRRPDQDEWNEGFREHLFGVAAVRLPGPSGPNGPISGLVPAMFTLRSGLAKAMQKAIELFPFAENVSGYASRSAAHATASKAIFPGGRFIVTIEGSVEPGSDDNNFNLGHGEVRPTPEADVATFNAWANPKGPNWATIARMVALNDKRVAEAKKNLRD